MKRLLNSAPGIGFVATVLVLVGAISWVVVTDRTSTRERHRLLEAGQAAPEFELSLLGRDSTVSLHDLAGNVILVEFWATWCYSCQVHLQEMQALHDDLGARHLKVLGITIDSKRDMTRAAAMASDLGITFSLLEDPRGEVHRAYRARGVPAFFLIGRSGELIAQSPGYPFERKVIEEALAWPDSISKPVTNQPD